MNAGVVDQDMDRAGGEEVGQPRCGRLAFGDVENDCFHVPAGDDFTDDRLGPLAATVGLHDAASVGWRQAVRSTLRWPHTQPGAGRGKHHRLAAADQGAGHDHRHQLRPLWPDDLPDGEKLRPARFLGICKKRV